MKHLLFPDGTDGGSSQPAKPAPPASAAVVANAKTERELELERELENERRATRKLQTDLAHVQDENSRFREIGLKAPKVEPKAEPASQVKSSWSWLFES